MGYRAILSVVGGVAPLDTLSAFQVPFRECPGVEYRLGTIPLPADWQAKTEWTFARLMYLSAPGMRGGIGAGLHAEQAEPARIQ